MASLDPKDPLIKRTRQLTLIARLRLFWERFAPVFALCSIFLIVFLIGSFGGIWERFGDPLRAIAGLVAIYMIFKASRAAAKRRLPTRSEARRRVERDSGVKHRPLDTLSDAPALSKDLWPAHYEKARRASAKLDAPIGRPALAPIDPYYLRFILPIALGLSLMVGAGDNFERLRRSLTPVWQNAISPSDVTFEAWVDPPDYTGRPPIYFKNQTKIDIPAGSELVARMSGVKDATRLKLKTSRRSRYLPLTRLGPKSFEARTIINEQTTARWRVGSTEKSWALKAIPDKAPTVSFNINPRADKRDRLVFTYSFSDDYGVENLSLKLRVLKDNTPAEEDYEIITVPLAGQSVRTAEFDKAALDMTKHRWAGRKVAGRLIAKDGVGQIAETSEVFFTIPDKIFVEPLAKAAAEQRSLVMAGWTAYQNPPVLTRQDWAVMPWFDTFQPEQRLGRAAPSVQRAAALIDAVTDIPEGLFEDPAVYLGFKNVLSRLRYAREIEALEGIPEDLWNIAIRAEFGILGTALEDMREAGRALRDGMARRAPQREIDTLFDRYNEAVDRYMEELRRKAMEEGNVAQGPEGGGGSPRDMDEIEALQKAIEEANRIGDTEGARKALAQLMELLENMEIQLSASGGGGDGDPGEGEMSEEMKEALEELADLLGDQRELKDETEQAERQQGNGDETGEDAEAGDSAPSQQELAQRQRALQESLDKLAENLPLAEAGNDAQSPSTGGDETGAQPGEGQQAGGTEDGDGDEAGSGEAGGTDPNGTEKGATGGGTENPGGALEDAERAMSESRNALGRGDLEGAARAQSQAIEALRRTGRGLAEQAEANRQANAGEGSGGRNENPLGQNDNGANDEDSEADIDQRDNATRSRELLEELRRRASEQEREESERDYLERLLKRF